MATHTWRVCRKPGHGGENKQRLQAPQPSVLFSGMNQNTSIRSSRALSQFMKLHRRRLASRLICRLLRLGHQEDVFSEEASHRRVIRRRIARSTGLMVNSRQGGSVTANLLISSQLFFWWALPPGATETRFGKGTRGYLSPLVGKPRTVVERAQPLRQGGHGGNPDRPERSQV